ncbi:hypothetical protein SAMN02746041_02956 [Desulfacinum hydrothermale DSM 13146]|uniref:Histone methylation protein DOT1 n=2 Tax=Desulfacinum hydrothermale TaxID=109258 RepID=A0A1W1XTY8_9BACT|nr:hypothetical protein SAMN02746041_02956 [Desulfacinum hydrothermale DSM 13146]
MASRENAQRVSAHFRRRHRERSREGGPYKMTPLGAWAASDPDALIFFFGGLALEECRLFCDLGSGDGTAVCCAALFTRAVGIEADLELCREAAAHARALHLVPPPHFVCADYSLLRPHHADCLYLYPDKPPSGLHHLVPPGWSGRLLIYGPHFPPEGFRCEKVLRWNRESLHVYRRLAHTGK